MLTKTAVVGMETVEVLIRDKLLSRSLDQFEKGQNE